MHAAHTEVQHVHAHKLNTKMVLMLDVKTPGENCEILVWPLTTDCQQHTIFKPPASVYPIYPHQTTKGVCDLSQHTATPYSYRRSTDFTSSHARSSHILRAIVQQTPALQYVSTALLPHNKDDTTRLHQNADITTAVQDFRMTQHVVHKTLITNKVSLQRCCTDQHACNPILLVTHNSDKQTASHTL